MSSDSPRTPRERLINEVPESKWRENVKAAFSVLPPNAHRGHDVDSNDFCNDCFLFVDEHTYAEAFMDGARASRENWKAIEASSDSPRTAAGRALYDLMTRSNIRLAEGRRAILAIEEEASSPSTRVLQDLGGTRWANEGDEAEASPAASGDALRPDWLTLHGPHNSLTYATDEEGCGILQCNRCESETLAAPLPEGLDASLDRVLIELREEVGKARAKHPPMSSPHEGWAVIYEELQPELWEHVCGDTGRSPEARKEALQIAAMGLRYILDLIDDPPASQAPADVIHDGTFKHCPSCARLQQPASREGPE